MSRLYSVLTPWLTRLLELALHLWASHLENESSVDAEWGFPEASTHWSPTEVLESMDSGSKSGSAPVMTGVLGELLSFSRPLLLIVRQGR